MNAIVITKDWNDIGPNNYVQNSPMAKVLFGKKVFPTTSFPNLFAVVTCYMKVRSYLVKLKAKQYSYVIFDTIKSTVLHYFVTCVNLTLSWRRPLPYRNQSIDLKSKSMDWFLYDNILHHPRVNP